jgi:hypothetical protein
MLWANLNVMPKPFQFCEFQLWTLCKNLTFPETDYLCEKAFAKSVQTEIWPDVQRLPVPQGPSFSWCLGFIFCFLF